MTLHHPHVSDSRRSRRAGAGIVLSLAALCVTLPAVANGPIRAYAHLTLKDGRAYADVEVINYTSTGILVRHAGGATTIRRDLLPDTVVQSVHLSIARAAELNDPAYLSLADKPAMEEGAASTVAGSATVLPIADRPAVIDASAALAHQPAVEAGSAIAHQVARQDPPPAGEGNIPDFFSRQDRVAVAGPAAANHVTGRVVVALPSGETRLLADVEVNAYPAELLATYLLQAKTRGEAAAQKYLDEAALAERHGRIAESASLLARARSATENFGEYLPPAPYSTRSDAYGHFTLRHDLRDIRLVARGRVTMPHGEWNYRWLGVAPQAETLLTEANAKVLPPSAAARGHLASR